MSYIARRNFRNNPPLSIPPGLDPDRFPIITQHVYGVAPAELRLQRQAERFRARRQQAIIEPCRALAEMSQRLGGVLRKDLHIPPPECEP